MATTTIGSTGDEPDQPGWEAVLQGLSPITGTETGELQNEEHAANVYSGITTSGAGKVVLKCAANASFMDNMVPATDALKYDATKGARIVTSSAAYCVDAATFAMEVVGVMMLNSNAGGGGVRLTGNAGTALTVKNCIIRLTGGGAPGGEAITLVSGGGGGAVDNNLVELDTTAAKTGVYTYYMTTTARNNQVLAVSGTGHGGFYVIYGGSVLDVIANYANTAADVTNGGGASITGTNNVTSLASSGFPATGLRTSKALTNQVVNVANDFRTKTGADLIDAGHSSGASDDIYGRTRSGTKDAGVDEYQSGAAPAPVLYRLTGRVRQAIHSNVVR